MGADAQECVRHAALRSFGALGLLTALACSSADEGGGEGRGGSGANPFGNAQSGDGSGTGTAGTGTDTGTPTTPPTPVVPVPTAGIGAGGTCGMGMLSAKLTPVNMLVMFDRSQSMNDNDKWPNATAALVSFFQNAGSAGLRIALRFFPHDDPAEGCSEEGCDAQACSEPLVSIGELLPEPAPQDAHESALVDAIDRAAPGDGDGQGTPIYAALDGSLRWAASDRALHPEENTVVIFVTDGEPNGCDEDFDNISTLASDALSRDGTTTYAIGLEGSNEEQMDQLAQAGGTQSGIFIGNSANAEQELLTALDAIRGETLSCDFAMPAPLDADVPIDPTKVNLTYTAGSGMAATLGQVVDGAACGATRGWHYDVPQAPTRIVLCPAACEIVQADPDAKLDLVLGCETCGGLDMSCADSPPSGLPPVL